MSKSTRQQLLRDNTALIEQLCARRGLDIESLNHGYQLRINGVMDLYPIGQRFHDLTTGARGGWGSPSGLRRLLQLDAVIAEAEPMPEELAEALATVSDTDRQVADILGYERQQWPNWRRALSNFVRKWL